MYTALLTQKLAAQFGISYTTLVAAIDARYVRKPRASEGDPGFDLAAGSPNGQRFPGIQMDANGILMANPQRVRKVRRGGVCACVEGGGKMAREEASRSCYDQLVDTAEQSRSLFPSLNAVQPEGGCGQELASRAKMRPPYHTHSHTLCMHAVQPCGYW